MATAIEYGLVAALVAVAGVALLERCSDTAGKGTAASAAVAPVQVPAEPERFVLEEQGVTPESYYASRGGPPWYEKAQKPLTLKAALADERRFLGEKNVGYSMGGDKEVCAVLKKVEVPCDYNSRGTLSMFLTVNGKGLFPASGGTNPYFNKHEPFEEGLPDDYFIGQPVQNRMLREAVVRNADLFKNGLTAQEVKLSWR
jgi:hypothetical protein